MARERHTLRYHGQVQGVGFRFAAIRVAAGLEVTGYVRNMPDGSVECVIEGEQPEIDAFESALKSQMDYYIRRVEKSQSRATGVFSSFDVRY